jgi:hypothetical protein
MYLGGVVIATDYDHVVMVVIGGNIQKTHVLFRGLQMGALILRAGRASIFISYVSKYLVVGGRCVTLPQPTKLFPQKQFGGLFCLLYKLLERPSVWVQLWSRNRRWFTENFT